MRFKYLKQTVIVLAVVITFLMILNVAVATNVDTNDNDTFCNIISNLNNSNTTNEGCHVAINKITVDNSVNHDNDETGKEISTIDKNFIYRVSNLKSNNLVFKNINLKRGLRLNITSDFQNHSNYFNLISSDFTEDNSSNNLPNNPELNYSLDSLTIINSTAENSSILISSDYLIKFSENHLYNENAPLKNQEVKKTVLDSNSRHCHNHEIECQKFSSKSTNFINSQKLNFNSSFLSTQINFTHFKYDECLNSDYNYDMAREIIFPINNSYFDNLTDSASFGSKIDTTNQLLDLTDFSSEILNNNEKTVDSLNFNLIEYDNTTLNKIDNISLFENSASFLEFATETYNKNYYFIFRTVTWTLNVNSNDAMKIFKTASYGIIATVNISTPFKNSDTSNSNFNELIKVREAESFSVNETLSKEFIFISASDNRVYNIIFDNIKWTLNFAPIKVLFREINTTTFNFRIFKVPTKNLNQNFDEGIANVISCYNPLNFHNEISELFIEIYSQDIAISKVGKSINQNIVSKYFLVLVSDVKTDVNNDLVWDVLPRSLNLIAASDDDFYNSSSYSLSWVLNFTSNQTRTLKIIEKHGILSNNAILTVSALEITPTKTGASFINVDDCIKLLFRNFLLDDILFIRTSNLYCQSSKIISWTLILIANQNRIFIGAYDNSNNIANASKKTSLTVKDSEKILTILNPNLQTEFAASNICIKKASDIILECNLSWDLELSLTIGNKTVICKSNSWINETKKLSFLISSRDNFNVLIEQNVALNGSEVSPLKNANLSIIENIILLSNWGKIIARNVFKESDFISATDKNFTYSRFYSCRI